MTTATRNDTAAPAAQDFPEVAPMSVQVLQENLKRGLTIVAPAIPKRHTLPILANVKLDTDRGRLRLQATDLDVAIETFIGTKVEGTGAITASLRDLLAVVKTLPKVTCELTVPAHRPKMTSRSGAELTVTAARGNFRFDTMNADDYPVIKHAESTLAFFTITAKVLTEALAFVLPGCAVDDSRPVLNGVQFKLNAERKNELHLASADGFRLHVADTAIGHYTDGEPCEFVVPLNALSIVLKTVKAAHETIYDPISVTVATNPAVKGDGMISFGIGADTTVTAKLIPGTYPNYAQLIPDVCAETTTVRIPDMQQAVAVLKPARTASQIVRLVTNCETNALDLSTIGDDGRASSASVDATFGNPAKIAFNWRYLADALACFAAGSVDSFVTLGTSGPQDKGLLSRASDSWKIVVMPMFVQWEAKTTA